MVCAQRARTPGTPGVGSPERGGEDEEERKRLNVDLKAHKLELQAVKAQLSTALAEANTAGTLRLRVAELEAAVEERTVR